MRTVVHLILAIMLYGVEVKNVGGLKNICSEEHEEQGTSSRRVKTRPAKIKLEHKSDQIKLINVINCFWKYEEIWGGE